MGTTRRCRTAARTLLGAGLAALAVGWTAPAAHAATRVLGSNHVPAGALLAGESGGQTLSHCQEGERLPRGANALRLSIRSPDGPGPVVRVTALQNERPLARGARAAGWTEADVVVPLRRTVGRTTIVRLCLTIGKGTAIDEMGLRIMPAGKPSGPHLRVDFLRLGATTLRALTATPGRRPAAATDSPLTLLGTLLALVAAVLVR